MFETTVLRNYSVRDYSAASQNNFHPTRTVLNGSKIVNPSSLHASLLSFFEKEFKVWQRNIYFSVFRITPPQNVRLYRITPSQSVKVFSN